MVAKKKAKSNTKRKLTKFPKGKKPNPKQVEKLMKNAAPPAIVLDRVAKTFAVLERDRELLGTPLLTDGFLEHADERGAIYNIIHEPIGALALITSKPNTVRANHYHKEDAHLCYVVSGSIEYYERAAGSVLTPRKCIIKAGEGFYTGPMMEHAMYFPEQTTFLTLGRLSRMPDEYEKDLVRLKVPLVEPKPDVNATQENPTFSVTPTTVEPTGGTPPAEPTSGAV